MSLDISLDMETAKGAAETGMVRISSPAARKDSAHARKTHK
jgi:hypothetical protein